MRRVVLDKNADVAARKVALQTLVDARTPEARKICEQLLGERYLNVVAIRGLAQESDPSLSSSKIVGAYKNFALGDRPQVITALVSRAPWSSRTCSMPSPAGKIPRNDIAAFPRAADAQSERRRAHRASQGRCGATCAKVRRRSRNSIARLRKRPLRPTPSPMPIRTPGGRPLPASARTCHTLYGEGGKIGPDLTGANRDNLEYLLENIADPSAVVAPDFRMSLITLKDGRVLAGMVTTKNEAHAHPAHHDRYADGRARRDRQDRGEPASR